MSEPLPKPDPRCRIGRVTFHKVKSSRRLDTFNPVTNALLRARNERGK